MNGSRSVLRRRRRRNAVVLPADVEGRPPDSPCCSRRSIARSWRRSADLPDRQREVIVLRYWSGLTEAEIAAALGISVGAVKSSSSRGRAAVAAALGGAMSDDRRPHVRRPLAAANQVNENDLRPATRHGRDRAIWPMRRHIRWIAPVLAAAAVVGIAIGTASSSTTATPPRRRDPAPRRRCRPTPTTPTPTQSPARRQSPVSTAHRRHRGELLLHRLPLPVVELRILPAAVAIRGLRAGQAVGDRRRPERARPVARRRGPDGALVHHGYLGFRDITMVTSTSITRRPRRTSGSATRTRTASRSLPPCCTWCVHANTGQHQGRLGGRRQR